MMPKNLYISTILFFFTFVYLLPLGARPLLVPDESRYAEVSREMVASGNWVVPYLNGVKYYEKPIMGYWVHAIFQKGLGESNFSVRLPSAISTGLTALIIYSLLANMLGRQDSRVYLAPLVFLSSFGIFGIGTIAVLDNLLNFFLTSSVVLFFLATEKKNSPPTEKLLLLLSGVAVGCAFLTKGFLAFVVPIITVTPYLLWQRRGKEILRLFWIPTLAAVAISLPWAIKIHLNDPEFWDFFFWHEHIKRFFSDNAQHHEPFWYFFFTIIPLFLPWIFLVPSACYGLLKDYKRNEAISRIIALCLCWLILPFLFFSFSKGKLATYILPCFPPLVILTSIGLYSSVKKVNKFLRVGISIIIFLTIIGLLSIVGSQILNLNIVSLPEVILKHNPESLRYSESSWKPILILISLSVMVFFCTLAIRCKEGEKTLVFIAISPLLLMMTTCLALPDLTLKVKAPGVLLEKEAGNIPEDAIILSDSETVAAACWYLKRNDLFLIGSGGELNYGLEKEAKEGKLRRLSYPVIQQLLATNKKKTIVLILRTNRWWRYMHAFAKPVEFISTGKNGYAVVKY